MLAVRFEAEAQEELESAAAWYESQRDGLGIAFIEAIRRTIARAARMPNAFPVLEGSTHEGPIRRAIVKRFPFVVIFIATSDELRVLSISHGRRQPVHWGRRLDDLGSGEADD